MESVLANLLKVGTKVVLEFIESGQAFESKILDWIEQKSLFIAAPDNAHNFVELKVGARVIVEIHAEEIYRFQSEISDYQISNLISLTCPAIIEQGGRRRASRHKVFIKTDISYKKDSLRTSYLQGYMLDLSLTGCSVLVNLSHLLQKEVELTFKIPWTDETIQVDGRVVRFDTDEHGSRSGIQFNRVKDDLLKRLTRCIENLENIPNITH